MSRFRKLSHSIWHCQYPIVWTPRYRFRILTGSVGEEVGRCIRSFSEQQKCEVVELNVQSDPVHLLVMIPPKVAVGLCWDGEGTHGDPGLQPVPAVKT